MALRSRGGDALRRPAGTPPRADGEPASAAEEARRHAVAGALERSRRSSAAGEQLVAAALEPLRDEGWQVTHGAPWPGRPDGRIDHLLVGPGGVVVADTEVWADPVEVRGGIPRQNGRRKRSTVASVEAMTHAVRERVPSHVRDLVHGAVCLAGQDQPPLPSEKPGVVVVGRLGVAGWCRSLPPAMGPADVELVAGLLRSSAEPVACELVERELIEPVELVEPEPEPVPANREPVLGTVPVELPAPRRPRLRSAAGARLAGARARTRARGALSSGLKVAVAASVVLTVLAWAPQLSSDDVAAPPALVLQPADAEPGPTGGRARSAQTART